VVLWHGFLSTGYAWRDVASALAEAGMAVLVPDMRGFGDSDKPDGTKGYDARALAMELRSIVASIGFGGGKPILLAAHHMGAPPALIWAADHPDEVAGLLYIEAPVMLGNVLSQVIAYNRDAMTRGSMWWWILPLAPGVPERLIVGNERAFLTWFYEGAAARPDVFDDATVGASPAARACWAPWASTESRSTASTKRSLSRPTRCACPSWRSAAPREDWAPRLARW